MRKTKTRRPLTWVASFSLLTFLCGVTIVSRGTAPADKISPDLCARLSAAGAVRAENSLAEDSDTSPDAGGSPLDHMTEGTRNGIISRSEAPALRAGILFSDISPFDCSTAASTTAA